MEYRNAKNGAVIHTESKLGGVWLPVEPAAKSSEPAPKMAAAPKPKPAGRKRGATKK